MLKIFKSPVILIAILILSASVFTQTKPRKTVRKKPAAKTKTIVAAPVIPVKKNERPPDETVSEEPAEQTEPKKNSRDGKNNSRPAAKKAAFEPTYFYEFSQPNFTVSNVKIEHDEKGKGIISFMKGSYDETISDPIQLSAATLEKINAALAALNFLDANENYQFDKDYSHLGNMIFRLKKDARERETKFNYTTNKDAKALQDEYRRIANQYIWMFDIGVSRENQPLEAPGLVDTFDSLMRRNEISDPVQMLPFLKELSNDERIPLIARNHTTKLITKIEKGK